MLNLEDDDFIREYRNSRFHRFREIERFAILDKKFSKYQYRGLNRLVAQRLLVRQGYVILDYR